MRNIYLITSIIIICIFYHGCAKEKSKQQQFSTNDFQIIINESNGELIDHTKQFNNLIDSINYIQLESTPNSLFGDISRLEMINDTIMSLV